MLHSAQPALPTVLVYNADCIAAPNCAIAPIRKMPNAGVPVGLDVGGSTSNDAAHKVNEARQVLLLAHVGWSLEPLGLRPRPQ